MLRAVFFDAAGTLCHTRKPVGQIYAEVARRFGVEADPREVGAAFRRGFVTAPGLAFGPGRPADQLRRLERRWWRERVAETFSTVAAFPDFDAYFDALFAHLAEPGTWMLDPEALPVLETLSRPGLVLGVISNFDHRLYRILEGLGASRYFSSITISSEAGYAKPSPRLFAAALEKHELVPADALHIGDSEALDVTGATAAGLGAILVEAGAPAPVALEGRTARVARLSLVPDAVRRLFPGCRIRAVTLT